MVNSNGMDLITCKWFFLFFWNKGIHGVVNARESENGNLRFDNEIHYVFCTVAISSF